MTLTLGHTVREDRQFSQEAFDEYARLSGDDNPIHVDPLFSARTRFGRTVAHGMLLYGTICGLISRHWPGMAQLEQSLMFPAPTYVGDLITTAVEVVAVAPDGRQARLRIAMTNPEGQLTCEGEAMIGVKTEAMR